MAEGHSTTLYDFEYEVCPPPSSSDWVQIWRIGTSNYIRQGGYTEVKESYIVKMPGSQYTTFEYNCDMYLSSNQHIIKISKRCDRTNNYPCLYFTLDDNKEIIGSAYITNDDIAPYDNPGTYLTPAGNYINKKWYIYDLFFFKKAPEGDFKTWLENNCRRIL